MHHDFSHSTETLLVFCKACGFCSSIKQLIFSSYLMLTLNCILHYWTVGVFPIRLAKPTFNLSHGIKLLGIIADSFTRKSNWPKNSPHFPEQTAFRNIPDRNLIAFVQAEDKSSQKSQKQSYCCATVMKDGEKHLIKKCSERFHPSNIFRAHQSSVNSLLLLSFLHTRALSAFILSFLQMHEYWRIATQKSCRFTGEGKLVLPGVSTQFFTLELW